jgi:hypothetical protein
MVRDQPAVEQLDDLHQALPEAETAWRLVATITGVALNPNPHQNPPGVSWQKP